MCFVPSNYDSISPLDDLAFDMYQDPEVAHIIRVLDQKKQEAVRQENYEEAKNLKQAVADLQKVGQQHTKYPIRTSFTVYATECRLKYFYFFNAWIHWEKCWSF